MVTSAYLLSGPEPALVETGPTTSSEAVIAGLDSLGVGSDDLAHIVVTHIHLDHAGGAGRIAAHYPRATVWAHDRGAPHMADPTRLVESAARLYGPDRLERLFGPVDPVPATRLRAVGEGDRITMGNRELDVLYTPGHASHHVALADSDTGAVFAGDALGIHFPDVGVLRPATPPPDVDVELAVESIDRIRRRSRTLLLFSHFGPVTEIEELCTVASSRLEKWAGIVRDALDETEDLARITEILEQATSSEFADASPSAELDRYEILLGMDMNAAGLVRYWRKRADRERAAADASPAHRPDR